MILEFVGLPGSGKTTLCDELRRWLASIDADQPEMPASAANRKPLRMAMGVIRHSRAALLAARVLIVSPRNWNEKRLAARWFLSTLSLYPSGNRSRPHVVLDEGLLQRSFLIFMEQSGFGPVDRVARYVEAIPLPDVVIKVDLAPADSLARLANRDRPAPLRFRTMSEGDLLKTFSLGEELFDLVLAQAVGRRGSSIQIIRVPGDDLHKAKQLLAVEIAQKLGIRMPQP